MKLVYQYMAIFFTFSPTSSHLHPLQVENCDSNSRLVVDEDDNGKFRLERDKQLLNSGFSEQNSDLYKWSIIYRKYKHLINSSKSSVCSRLMHNKQPG